MQHTRRVLLPIACPQSAPESSVCKRPREVRPSVRGTWYRRIITDSRTILCALACVRLGAFAYVCCLRIHEPTSAESDNDQQQSKQQLLAHTQTHTRQQRRNTIAATTHTPSVCVRLLTHHPILGARTVRKSASTAVVQCAVQANPPRNNHAARALRSCRSVADVVGRQPGGRVLLARPGAGQLLQEV